MVLRWLKGRRAGSAAAATTRADEAPPQDALALGLAAHRAGDLAAAEARYREHLARCGDDARALHLLGVLLAQRGEPGEACSRIERAVALGGQQSAMLVDLGNVRMLLGQAGEAIEAYRKAAEVEPGNAMAWGNLAAALAGRGEFEAAAEACRRGLAARPADVDALAGFAATLRACGARDEGEAACRAALARAPGHAEALRVLGHLLLDRAEASEALDCFRALADAHPQDARAHTSLGAALERCGDADAAIAACETAVRMAPADAHAHAGLAGVLWRTRRLEEAVRTFRRALDLDAGALEARANLAALLESMSRLDEAAEEAAAGLRHHPHDAYLNLVAAQCARRSGDAEASLRRLEGIDVRRAPLDLQARIGHEVGRLHDALGDPARAFEALRAANAVAASSPEARAASPERYLGEIAAASATVPRLRPLAGDPGAPARAESPAFVVGFPRSGTTLSDQILDSHPAARTLSEKPVVDRIVQRFADLADGYPAALERISAHRLTGLREEYRALAQTFVEVRPGELLVDRYPLNLVRLPAIWRLFPRAPVVLALRHPCDVVLSCWMQHFSINDAMASFLDLDAAARLYDAVMGLWRTCTEHLDLDVHVLRYESLVENFEPEVRALLAFLDLPWDERVLGFAEHARARADINTPSYHQVTRGIYTDARERWRRYAEPMASVLPVLAPWAEYFGYSVQIDA